MRGDRSRRARTGGVGVLVLTGALLLAACGSRLDPDEVVGLGAAGAGVAPDGTVVDGAVPGTDPEVPGGAVDAGGGTTTGTGTDPARSGGGGSAGSGGAAEPPAGGGEENAADGGVRAGSCEGFDNDQPGITEDTITLANVADISGPVPGIFEAAQQGTRAFVEYFNSTQDLCGHKLAVELLDSRADAGADQQAYATACDKTFAAVGSMGAFDSGGAATAAGCGLPDLRSASTTPERNQCATCFSAQALTPHLIASAVPKFFLKEHREAAAAVGILYINAGAAAPNAAFQRNAWVKAGWKVPYFQGIDVAEFNYAPYVQAMKDKGVKMVVYTGPYQNSVKIQQAMQQQGFEALWLQDPTIYDQGYVDQAGSLGEGSYVYSTFELFDSNVPEMKLYRAWLDQVSPGAEPNFYGLYAWSAARLFVQQAVALGGDLTRESLVASLRKVKDWTSNGIHAPQQVGTKVTANCIKIFQLNGGSWRQVSSGDYMCEPLINGA
jgi:ABC-type branched-subunit amino acid transport system substrate-binding protein